MYRVNSTHGKMALVHAARYHALQEHLSVRGSSRKSGQRCLRSKKPSLREATLPQPLVYVDDPTTSGGMQTGPNRESLSPLDDKSNVSRDFHTATSNRLQ